MNFIVEEELNNLKKLLSENKMEPDKANNFIDISDYEDEYSRNEIYNFHTEFIDEAVIYLEENYNGQYFIFSDWCVHIVTVEFYEKKLNPYNKRGIMC